MKKNVLYDLGQNQLTLLYASGGTEDKSCIASFCYLAKQLIERFQQVTEKYWSELVSRKDITFYHNSSRAYTQKSFVIIFRHKTQKLYSDRIITVLKK